MLDFLNEILSVIASYVAFLMQLEFLPGVSMGSVLLLSLLLYVIVANLWRFDYK